MINNDQALDTFGVFNLMKFPSLYAVENWFKFLAS